VILVLLVICLLSFLGVVTFALLKKGDVVVSMSLFRRLIELSIDAKDKPRRSRGLPRA